MKCAECPAEVLTIDAEVDPQAVTLRLRAQCGHVVEPEAARVLWQQGMRWALPVVDGASLLAAERYRQVHEEGHTPERDAALTGDELPWAAWVLLDQAASGEKSPEPPRMWPWPDSWKPHDPMRSLVIAGALIAAEIDRRLTADRTKGTD